MDTKNDEEISFSSTYSDAPGFNAPPPPVVDKESEDNIGNNDFSALSESDGMLGDNSPLTFTEAGPAGPTPYNNANPDIFDPDIHASDENGNPVKNKNGRYRKKRGRKKGTSDAGNAGQQIGAMMAGVFLVLLNKSAGTNGFQRLLKKKT